MRNNKNTAVTVFLENVKNAVVTVFLLPAYTCFVLVYCVHLHYLINHPDSIARRKSNTPEEIEKRRQNAEKIINEEKTNYFIKPRQLFITHEERVWSKPSLCTPSSERTVKLRNSYLKLETVTI